MRQIFTATPQVLSAGHIVMGKKRAEHRPVVTNRPTCARVEL